MATASEKWRQISRMIGVWAAIGVEVPASIGKSGAATGFALMDMKAKNAGSTGVLATGKPVYIGNNHCAVCRPIEGYGSRNLVPRFLAADPGHRQWPAKMDSYHLSITSTTVYVWKIRKPPHGVAFLC